MPAPSSYCDTPLALMDLLTRNTSVLDLFLAFTACKGMCADESKFHLKKNNDLFNLIQPRPSSTIRPAHL